MPGLLFSVNINRSDLQKAISFLNFPGFTIKSHSNVENRHFVAEYTYKGYPTQIWKRGHKQVFFEGMIYPKVDDTFSDELFNFFTPSGFSDEIISKWVAKQDGEFVILLVDNNLQQALFINDRFGRLPVYLLKEGRKLALSREISFIHRLRTFDNPDIIGQAQTLLFGFAIGKRTIWERIERVEPHTQIQIDLINGRIMHKSYFGIPDQITVYDSSSHISELGSRFDQALKNRLSVLDKPAVSLSGGLDSRLIAASLSNQNQGVPFITYNDFDQSASKDLSSAAKVIQLLGIEEQYQVIDLPQVSYEEINHILRIKQGLNGADMAFILPFLNHFKKNDYMMITGDGGDKTLDDLRPLVPIISIHHLVNYLLRKHSQISIKEAAEIFSLKPDDLYQSIVDQLNAYNADSLINMHIHFMIRERAMNWLFEGEDRNRYFTWTTTPYYSNDFFNLAMQLPMKEKSYGRTFRKLFANYPGNLETIVNPNWNASLFENHKIQQLFLRQKIRFFIPNVILNFRFNYTQRIDIESFIKEIGMNVEDLKFTNSKWIEQLKILKLPKTSWYRILSVLRTS